MSRSNLNFLLIKPPRKKCCQYCPTVNVHFRNGEETVRRANREAVLTYLDDGVCVRAYVRVCYVHDSCPYSMCKVRGKSFHLATVPG